MTKTLIVYHSRTGYTRRIARHLADRLGADLDEIRIVQPMHGVLGYAACAIEAMAGLAPALRPMRHKPADYDLIIVGTPVWFWNLSSPVRSWLENFGSRGKRFAFFCTMGGSGASRVFGSSTPSSRKCAGAARGAARSAHARRTLRRDRGCRLIRRTRGAGRGARLPSLRVEYRAPLR